MNRALHITNGDSTVRLMQQAGIQGALLPWRDVLHEGPVPGGLSLCELSSLRAAHLSAIDWGNKAQISASFQERNHMLMQHNQYDEVILWFEHDLYDQLQLLQILDWFAVQRACPVKMICIDQYLGELEASVYPQLLVSAKPVSTQQFSLAQQAWQAFTDREPQAWESLLSRDTEALPYLADTVLRLLQEYPDCSSLLQKTATMALELLQKGPLTPWALFQRYQDAETRRFLGDLSFWKLLNELRQSQTPLIALQNEPLGLPGDASQQIYLTQAGRERLQTPSPSFPHTLSRWIGGVHLSAENVWCWDPVQQKLTRHQP